MRTLFAIALLFSACTGVKDPEVDPILDRDSHDTPDSIKAQLCATSMSSKCEAVAVSFAEHIARDGDPLHGFDCHNALKALMHVDTAHRHGELLSRLRGKCCPLDYSREDKELCAAGLSAWGK